MAAARATRAKKKASPVRGRRQGRPPGADAEATQRSILESALEAFARHGYEGVSVRELTRSLGVSHNLVHHYFGSKERLWRAAMDYALRRVWALVEGLDALGSEDDPFEALANALRGAVHLFRQLPSVPRILARESAEAGPRIEYICERYLDPVVEIAKHLLARLEAAGAARIDPRSFVLLLGVGTLSLFTYTEIARRMGGPDPASEEAADRHAEALVQLALGGLRPPAAI